MLLILDLDETLVYSTTARLEAPPDFQVGQYSVYRRPSLDDFLNYASMHFALAVWTSSGKEYARQVVERIFSDRIPLVFIWTSEKCTPRSDAETRETCWVKNLKKVKNLGFPLGQILVVDDSPEKLALNYGNHLRIVPFEGKPGDQELTPLTRYLGPL